MIGAEPQAAQPRKAPVEALPRWVPTGSCAGQVHSTLEDLAARAAAPRLGRASELRTEQSGQVTQHRRVSGHRRKVCELCAIGDHVVQLIRRAPRDCQPSVVQPTVGHMLGVVRAKVVCCGCIAEYVRRAVRTQVAHIQVCRCAHGAGRVAQYITAV